MNFASDVSLDTYNWQYICFLKLIRQTRPIIFMKDLSQLRLSKEIDYVINYNAEICSNVLIYLKVSKRQLLRTLLIHAEDS